VPPASRERGPEGREQKPDRRTARREREGPACSEPAAALRPVAQEHSGSAPPASAWNVPFSPSKRAGAAAASTTTLVFPLHAVKK
jgi:hypothetical protein